MTDPLDTWKAKEEDAIIAKSEEVEVAQLRAKCERLETQLNQCADVLDEAMRQRGQLEAQSAQMREALEHIARYPVHSEPMGGALDMQDIASNALCTTAGTAIIARLEEARRLLGDDFFEENPGKWRQRRDQWLKSVK